MSNISDAEGLTQQSVSRDLFGNQVLQYHESSPVSQTTQSSKPQVVRSVPDVVIDFRLRNGLCHACGTRVYQINESGRVSPLTLPGVAKEGRCLHCYPDREEFDPTARKRRRRTSDDAVSLTNSASFIKSEPLDVDDEVSNCCCRHSVESTTHDHRGFSSRIGRGTVYSDSDDATEIGKEVTIRDAEGKKFVGMVLKGNTRRGSGRFRCFFKRGPWKDKESVYEGEFRNGKFEGEGTLDDVKGFVYKGSFSHGVANGYGVGTWGQGWSYKGEWVNDRREGRGILSQDVEGGEVYDGEWKDDKWHGQGELRFNGGGCYVGAFKNHKIEGQGRYVFVDGSVYEGTFENDLREGQGTMIYEDGTKYVGEWRNNWRDGNGSLYHTDGSEFRGTFRGDSKVCGVLYLSDGIMRREKYVDGVLQNS